MQKSFLCSSLLVAVTAGWAPSKFAAHRICGIAPHRSYIVALERTLTAATTWRLSLSLEAADASMKPALPLIANIVYDETPGYEPPQGTVGVVSTLPEGVLASGVIVDARGRKKSTLQWKLSEDPDDPKDSLWIWGLFKEPLYPFILSSLKLETEWAGYPAGTEIFLQGEHRRDKKTGTRLGAGTLTLRKKLALPGGADAGSAFEPVPCGTYQVLE
jgi:hypothetical protein